MDSTERVRNAIQGKPLDRQPIYGWVSANLSEEIADVWGSVAAFEDHYEFDMANMKRVVDYVHSRGALASLHSDGCVMKVADGIAQLGLDVVHPWQESAGMSYDTYLEKYADRFTILGGVCVQSAIDRKSTRLNSSH